MIEYLVHILQIYVLPWGAKGVFLASVAEEVIAPIPSAMVMTMSGFLLVSGPFSWQVVHDLIFRVAVPAALGVTLGSYVIFYISKFGGRFIIERWGKYVGLLWSDIEKMQNKLSGTKRDEVIIGAARIMPFIPSVAISAFCGILDMNPIKYFIISFSGVFVRGIILGAIGWQVGSLYEKYAIFINKMENWFLISTILAVLIFIVIKYKSKSKKQEE